MAERYIYADSLRNFNDSMQASTGIDGLIAASGWQNEVALDAAMPLTVDEKTNLDSFMANRGYTFIRQMTTSIPFNGAAKINAVDEQPLTENGDRPSVAGYSLWVEANTRPTTIIDFTDGFEGQRIYLRFTTTLITTVQNNASIMTADGLNRSGSAGRIMALVKQGGVWREI